MIRVEKQVVDRDRISCDCHGKQHRMLYIIEEDVNGRAIFLCRAGLFDLKRTLHRITVKSRKT